MQLYHLQLSAFVRKERKERQSGMDSVSLSVNRDLHGRNSLIDSQPKIDIFAVSHWSKDEFTRRLENFISEANVVRDNLFSILDVH